MEHRQLLSQLGSQREAADAIGVKLNDIGHWKLRGIPARFWPKVARVATDRGIDVTVDDLAGLPRLKEAA